MAIGSRRPFILALVLLSAAAFMTCHLEAPPGEVRMNIEVDSTWTRFDSVVVSLRDGQGGILETLYRDSLTSPTDLQGLVTREYSGGKVVLVLEGYAGGQVAMRETREYDGDTGMLDRRSVLDLTERSALDIKPDNLTLYLGGEGRTLSPVPGFAGALAWESGEDTIVAVQDGALTAKAPGRTYVLATSGASRDSSWVEVVRDAPVLAVGGDTSVKVDARVTWKVKVTQEYGFIDVFKWDTDGDGRWDDSASGFSPNHTVFASTPRTYSRAETLTLRFFVRDGEGNRDSASRRLTVADIAPSIDSLAVDRRLVGIRDTLDFSARVSAGEGPRQRFSWDFDGNGTPEDTGSFADSVITLRARPAFSGPGQYRVVLRVVDGAGTAVSAMATIDVRLAPPRAEAGFDVEARAGTMVTLTGTSSDSLDGRIVKREWKVGTGSFVPADTSGSITIRADFPVGPVDCIFRVTDDDGLTAEDGLTLSVTDAKVPAISFIPRSAIVSIRDTLAFSVAARAQTGKLVAFAWDFDADGRTDDTGTVSADSILQTRSFRFNDTGTGYVVFRATDDAGKTGTATLPVTVKEDRPWVYAGQDTAVLAGQEVVLRGRAGDTLGRIVSLEWKVGAAAFAPAPQGVLRFTPTAPGEITCVFRATDDDGLASQATIRVTVGASNSAELSGLGVSAGILSPPFEAARLDYVDSVPNAVDSIKVTPSVRAGSGSVIQVDGRTAASGFPSAAIPLAVGRNTIAIRVTAQDGVTMRNYAVTVVRAPNGNVALSRLEPSVGTLIPAFDSAVTAYTLKVDSTVGSLSLTLAPRVATTRIEVNGSVAAPGAAHGPINLAPGSNRIAIVTESQAGTRRTYTLTVTRGPPLFVLDDFNARRKENALGIAWVPFNDATDRGNTRLTTADTSSTPFRLNDSAFTAGYGASGYAGRLGFVYGSLRPSCGTGCTYGQTAGIVAGLGPERNLAGATRITFHARASAAMTVNFVVTSGGVPSVEGHRTQLQLTTAWTRYSVAFADLVQPSWVLSPRAFDISRVRDISWIVSVDDNPALLQGVIVLDDVTIVGWEGP